MPPQNVVVIGAGTGGVESAFALRSHGFDGKIILLERQMAVPYQRPPLSKEFLFSTDPLPAPLRAPRLFREHDIDLRLGANVSCIDRRARVVHTDHEVIEYDALVLALGASPRTLAHAQGSDTPLHTLGTLEGAARVRTALDDAHRVAIIGAGFIGLELAAAATELGVDAVVVDGSPRALARSVSTTMAIELVSRLEADGVQFHFGQPITDVTSTGTGMRIHTPDLTVDADFGVLCIGVEPAVRLALEAGLLASNGITVDASMQTSDPAIWAVGDMACMPFEGRQVRFESVPAAIASAQAAARAILGLPPQGQFLPWFWSVQGKSRLQIAGLRDPNDIEIPVSGPNGELAVQLQASVSASPSAIETLDWPRKHVLARRTLANRITVPSQV